MNNIFKSDKIPSYAQDTYVKVCVAQNGEKYISIRLYCDDEHFLDKFEISVNDFYKLKNAIIIINDLLKCMEMHNCKTGDCDTCSLLEEIQYGGGNG